MVIKLLQFSHIKNVNERKKNKMINSKINWTDHSLNFWIGCKKIREGCANCYMFREQKRYGDDPANIHRTTQNTWNQVNKFKPGEKVFVCSWGDFFIEEADPWRDEAWAVMRKRPDLIWILLTKRIENVRGRLPADWGDGWPNVIGMVTAENQKWADHDIPILINLPFRWKGISIEPMLGPIDLDKTCGPTWCWRAEISWIICGGESGPGARPMHPDWPKVLRDQCGNMEIPFFMKQWGEWCWPEQMPDDTYLEIDAQYGQTMGAENEPYRVGKKKAGRLLDGKEWNQFPDMKNEG